MVLPTGTKGGPLVLDEKPELKEGLFSPAFVLPGWETGTEGVSQLGVKPVSVLVTGSSIYVNISACHMDNTACLKKSLINF